jgi:hypothetical protein
MGAGLDVGDVVGTGCVAVVAFGLGLGWENVVVAVVGVGILFGHVARLGSLLRRRG